MKLTIIVAFLLTSTSVWAQDTTKVDQYCELTATSRMADIDYNIGLDFGQRLNIAGNKSTRVMGEEGTKKRFYSYIAALNFMTERGWTVVAYFIEERTNRFLLKKRVAKSEIPALRKELDALMQRSESEIR